MTVSKGTNSDSKINEKDLLFPPPLIGKKLKPNKSNNTNTSECEYFLSNFLRSRDPQEFVNAIRSNITLLGKFVIKSYNPKRNRIATSEKKSKVPKNTVDVVTVVYETLSKWILLDSIGDENESTIANKFLSKIAPVLALRKDEVEERQVRDGLKHVRPKIKGTKPYLTYKSAENFIQRWDKIYNAFKETKSKKRYSYKDKALKLQDALTAIRVLGNELFDDEVGLLNLDNNRTKTMSYLKVVHENVCPICYYQEVSESTFRNLYNRAKSEIQDAR